MRRKESQEGKPNSVYTISEGVMDDRSINSNNNNNNNMATPTAIKLSSNIASPPPPPERSRKPNHLKLLQMPTSPAVSLTPDGSLSSPFSFSFNPGSNSSKRRRLMESRSISWNGSVNSSFANDHPECYDELPLRKRCQRRLSTYLHTHVILIIVCTLSIFDAICVIGQLICDILIIKEKLDYFESIDEELTTVLFSHLPHLNQSIHENWNLHAILSVLTGSDTHGSSGPLPFPTSINLTGLNLSVQHDHHHHVHKRAVESHVPGHEAEHGVIYHMTHVFHLASMVILSCLLLETLLKLFAMGKKLRHHRLEVFDAVVVAISWSLDVAFWEGIWAQPGTESASILIYLLPWRVVRIVNSFVLVIQEKDHVQLKIIKQRLRLSVKKSKEFTTKNSFLRHEVKALAGLCRKLGATEPEITACSPSGKAIRRSSIHSALERAASLTFISTMSSLGSVPSLFDMVESSSDEEDVRDLHPSNSSALKSTLSTSTQDSGSVAFSMGNDTLNHDVLDSPSSDNASNCTSISVSDEGSPRHPRGLANLANQVDKETVSRTDSIDSQPPSYHIATLDSDSTRL